MTSTRNPARKRSRSQAGSALVEGSLVILPLMAIFFALIDYPLAIFIQNTLRGAVREGVRYAITQQVSGGGHQDVDIKNVVEYNSLGFLNDIDIAAGNSSLTIQYYDKSLTQVFGTGSNGFGNICVVTAMIKKGWMAPLWRESGLVPFYASSSDVMENGPAGVIPAR